MGCGSRGVSAAELDGDVAVKRRFFLYALLAAGAAALIALALASQAEPVSTYSTFDTGRNGYAALFNVLRNEGVRMERLQQPLVFRDPALATIAFTSTAPERSTGGYALYDAGDYERLAAFQRRGGRLVYFASPQNDPMQRNFKKYKLHVVTLDATRFTNEALSKDPRAIVQAYDVLAGHGPVAFDERLHGYAIDRTMWSVMLWPVRTAFWIVILAIGLVLIEANIRFAPVLVREPPPDRDSAAYLASMAALLRRARAGRAAIARFAKTAAANDELQQLANVPRPSNAAVLRAALLASTHRKEGM